MEPSTTPDPTAQRLVRILLVVALIAAGLWVLREFFAALAWATVFAIALWPLYVRLLRALPPRTGPLLAPLLLTGAIAVVFIVPAALLGVAVAREAHVVIDFIAAARNQGIPMPDWLGHLPLVGTMAATWWHDNLADPETARELFGRFRPGRLAASAREYAPLVIHRLVIFFFMLLTVFFLFRDGSDLAEQLRKLSDRMLGRRGEMLAQQVIAAVHGTVTGLVLVGLAEGVLLAIVYLAVGVPYAASIGALTGVAAIIPFAAPIVYCLVGLYLFAGGNTVGAVIVVAIGSVVVFVADHFVRPFLIGGATRLPFLWVLLGILGGLGSFGFLGLFLGPAIMAALIALWREWTETPLPVEPLPSPPMRRGAASRRPSAARRI